MLPYSRQNISEDDIALLSEALRGDIITGGAWVERFERAIAEKCGVRFAVAVANGTAALHIAYAAAGLSEGDEVITTPITFAATANAALYLNGRVKFADIDPETGNMDENLALRLITSKTKVIAPVDYAGLAARTEELHKYSRGKAIFIVEDACHALGGFYESGEAIGSCRHSDMTVFSFHPVKNITTGEGGAVTTNDKALYEKLKLLRSHGISTDAGKSWVKAMSLLGFNYRITDFQCALGVSQLKKLDAFIAERRRLAAEYDKALKTPRPVGHGASARHAYHLYPVLLKTENGRNKLLELGSSRGIGFQLHYSPVYRHPYYKENGYADCYKYCPAAEDFASRVVSLPLYPFMTAQDQQTILDCLRETREWE
jgi:UDP-4-amino-4,6-dideoxy-N-acetyl-beta-L-altrosamine transaminase